MKKHNTLKVVLITLLTFLVLSWIFTSAYYSNGYVEQGRIQMGLFDVFSYPVTAISYFGYIALYVFIINFINVKKLIHITIVNHNKLFLKMVCICSWYLHKCIVIETVFTNCKLLRCILVINGIIYKLQKL